MKQYLVTWTKKKGGRTYFAKVVSQQNAKEACKHIKLEMYKEDYNAFTIKAVLYDKNIELKTDENNKIYYYNKDEYNIYRKFYLITSLKLQKPGQVTDDGKEDIYAKSV